MNIKYKLRLIYKLSLIHISEPTRRVLENLVCRLLLEKKKKKKKKKETKNKDNKTRTKNKKYKQKT